MTDSLGRSWQLGTVQLDYSMPERFDLIYTGADNAEHRPVMIHRALLGSFERFIGILHRALRAASSRCGSRRCRRSCCRCPTASTTTPRASREQLAAERLRVELDDRSESVGRKIRDAELRKIPYMLVVGEREEADGAVSVREHRGGERGRSACRRRSRERLQGAAIIAQVEATEILQRAASSDRLDARSPQLVPVPRRFDRRPPERDTTRINERIRVPEVRLIDDEGQQVGVLKIADALQFAQDRELDLVEVAPEARPPVCRVLDYSKYKYEQAQKQKQARKHQQQITVREIKFRPKIAEHDYDTKKHHVERFLRHKDKVKVTIMFRGREVTHPERGTAILDRLADELSELGVVEQRPMQEGRNMTMMMAPVEGRARRDASTRRRAGDAEAATVGRRTARPRRRGSAAGRRGLAGRGCRGDAVAADSAQAPPSPPRRAAHPPPRRAPPRPSPERGRRARRVGARRRVIISGRSCPR